MASTILTYCRSDDIPPLAWIASLNNADPVVRVVHGSHVETFDEFFIEGVWSGEFRRGNISATDCVFGSGGRIDRGQLTFVSSTATTSYLYYAVRDDNISVSNSLPLVLQRSDDRLDPKYAGYAEINASIEKGIRKYISIIPTMGGFVHRIMHSNLEVKDGVPNVVDKPMPPRFDSFESYDGYLRSSLSACFANARDPSRKTKLKVYSTQSKGYDTTAVNAVARDLGIDAVFTVRQGKANDRFAGDDAMHQTDDDGTPICDVLHLPVIALDRREFEKAVPYELYYWAGMHRSHDVNLCGMSKHIQAPALLLTGMMGEIWYAAATTVAGTINDELIRFSFGGWGLSEVRLKMGYVEVAVPFIGARRREDVFRISESVEMDPWRLGGWYDRPIPRRIAETAGVPRHLFGQQKGASMVEFPPPNVPFDTKLRRQYLEFLNSNGLMSKWGERLLPLLHRYNSFASYKGPSQNIHAYRVDRLLRKISADRIGLDNLWQKLDGSIYCFAVNRLVDETRLPPSA